MLRMGFVGEGPLESVVNLLLHMVGDLLHHADEVLHAFLAVPQLGQDHTGSFRLLTCEFVELHGHVLELIHRVLQIEIYGLELVRVLRLLRLEEAEHLALFWNLLKPFFQML